MIFPSNVLTVKGLTAINSLGYKIPDDFGVVGFDQGDNAEIYSPKLTYVYQPTELVAKQSFEMLHKMINEEEVSLSKTVASKFVLGMSSGSSKNAKEDSVLLCGSAFDDIGGWTSDSQFMDVMGSSYLLAHGLGHPVKDASTVFFVAKEGDYHIYVRTKNWTAFWTDKPTPGVFSLSIDSNRSEEHSARVRLNGIGRREARYIWHVAITGSPSTI